MNNLNDLVMTLAFLATVCFSVATVCATVIVHGVVKKLPSDDFTYTPPKDEDDGEAWKRGGINPSNN